MSDGCHIGDHYWVNAYVTPILKNGRIVEIQSVRTKPQDVQVERAEAAYRRLREGAAQPWAVLARVPFAARLVLPVVAVIVSVDLLAIALADLPAWPTLISSLCAGLIVVGTMVGGLAPLSRLAEKARSLADNPLSQPLYTRRTDDLGAIEFAMSMAHAETGSVIGRIADAAARLGTHTTELLEAVEASVGRAEEQYAETDQIATAVNEMTASMREVAANAAGAADAAENADRETRSGQRLVAATSDAIANLEAEILNAANVIQTLHGQTSEISQVLDVIRAIADQTNLLALNAAIEAARAGEQGRGFAVVADEVRGLAARTQKSTADIQDMISRLQEGARSAVAAMENSQHQAQASVSTAQQAARALEDIGGRVLVITETNAQIAAAVEQQGAVSEEINRSITNIRNSANLNVAGGRSTRERTAELQSLTAKLDELAQQFWRKRR
nr:methyl-accepting chemotaxis protein [Pseudomonas sp.]